MPPSTPRLSDLRRQAKALLKDYQAGDAGAMSRLQPAASPSSQPKPVRLADAQHAIAREHGFESWPRLKKHYDSLELHGQLKAAIDADDLAAVQRLVNSDLSLLQAPLGYGGSGPLTWAAECRGPATPPSENRLAIAAFLIAAGADIHVNGDAPLMRAALNDGRVPMMELLLQHGADVNAYWAGHYPILFAPCETLAPVVLQWLLDHGADPTVRGGANRDEGTALDMVIQTYGRSDRRPRCIRILQDAGATSRFDQLPVLDIHTGRLDRLAQRLEEDPALLHRRFPEMDYGSTAHRSLDLRGASLLHAAAEFGELEAARFLLDRGADPNIRATVDEKGVGGQTPLFHAVAQYRDFGVPAARLLIERGADVSVRARVGGRYDFPGETLEATALGYAVRFPYDQWECRGAVDLLLAHGAPAGDVYAAARLGLVEELKALLDAGADPDMTNLDGETALAAATAAGRPGAAELLIQAGAAPTSAS